MNSMRIGALFVSFLLSAPCSFPHLAQADEKATREIEVPALSAEEKVKWAHATKVPLVEATQTALSQTSGQAIQATLESLNGRLLYEIEIVTGEGNIVEVFIDPRSGKVIDAGGMQ